MTMHNRVVIESGKKTVLAWAIDWPGWARSAKSEEGALETLAGYAERYGKVVTIAGVEGVQGIVSDLQVIEHLEGTAMTDFGASGLQAKAEDEPMDDAECERQLALLEACWACFDDTAARVTEELQKGPRGGGRNRQKIIDHTFEAERSYARRIGVNTPKGGMDTRQGLNDHREAVCSAIRIINAGNGPEIRWSPRYYIRRAAWHVLDHAWEMQDKDLSER